MKKVYLFIVYLLFSGILMFGQIVDFTPEEPLNNFTQRFLFFDINGNSQGFFTLQSTDTTTGINTKHKRRLTVTDNLFEPYNNLIPHDLVLDYKIAMSKYNNPPRTAFAIIAGITYPAFFLYFSGSIVAGVFSNFVYSGYFGSTLSLGSAIAYFIPALTATMMLISLSIALGIFAIINLVTAIICTYMYNTIQTVYEIKLLRIKQEIINRANSRINSSIGFQTNIFGIRL